MLKTVGHSLTPSVITEESVRRMARTDPQSLTLGTEPLARLMGRPGVHQLYPLDSMQAGNCGSQFVPHVPALTSFEGQSKVATYCVVLTEYAKAIWSFGGVLVVDISGSLVRIGSEKVGLLSQETQAAESAVRNGMETGYLKNG